MKLITLEEQKKLQLDMLIYISEICNKNKLRYFLAGGTLLGAIRHKGYIPWDDDIDILMPRPDFNKLSEILSNVKHDHYKLLTDKQEDYYYLFNKLVDTRTCLIQKYRDKINDLGVFLDIFPIDGLPNEQKEFDIHVDTLLKDYNNFLDSKSDSYNISNDKNKRIIKTIVKYPLYLYQKRKPWKKRQQEIIKKLQKYNFDESNKVGCILSPYKKKEILNREVFSKEIMVDFEGEKFPAPIGYKKYLSALYGNYMELPPVEKRVTHHLHDAYWKD